VVLRAYEEWGPSCAERLRGMFAFAVRDVRRQEWC
jgi:asparagine synthase (glutamine-hydrolysing)